MTNRDFSLRLANFMTLLVSYLRTSVRLDPRDKETYAKAYPPIVSHSDFTKIFHDLLSENERAVFREFYGKADARNRLFRLASYNRVGGGNVQMFPRKVGASLTWDEVLDKLLRGESIHSELTPYAKEYGPEEVGPELEPRSKGLVLELRRIGFRWRPLDTWKRLALLVYDLVRRLNS